jgi:hypothetical protein
MICMRSDARAYQHLPAMVGFVRKQVVQHFQAKRPMRSPAVCDPLRARALLVTRSASSMQVVLSR